MSGKVEAIWSKRSRRGAMDPLDEAVLVEAKGLEDDTSFGRSKRQVTIIEREVFDRIRTVLPDATPEMRRANFMVSGIALEGSVGRTLVLGRARILVGGETRPCELMDEQCPGLRSALATGWGGGVHGVVLEGGPVRVGDGVALEASGRPERRGAKT